MSDPDLGEVLGVLRRRGGRKIWAWERLFLNLGEMTQKEIAGVVGCGVNTVRLAKAKVENVWRAGGGDDGRPR